MQTSPHSLELTLVLQEGKASTDGFIPEDLSTFIVVFRGKKGAEMCLNVVKSVMSTHHLGEEPVLDCPHVSLYQTHLQTANTAEETVRLATI